MAPFFYDSPGHSFSVTRWCNSKLQRVHLLPGEIIYHLHLWISNFSLTPQYYLCVHAHSYTRAQAHKRTNRHTTLALLYTLIGLKKTATVRHMGLSSKIIFTVIVAQFKSLDVKSTWLNSLWYTYNIKCSYLCSLQNSAHMFNWMCRAWYLPQREFMDHLVLWTWVFSKENETGDPLITSPTE